GVGRWTFAFRLLPFALFGGLLLFLSFVPIRTGAQSESPDRDTVVVVGEGMAVLNADPTAAEEEAVWDAKRNAVEQAAGLLVRSYVSGRDFQLEENEIRGRSEGFVKRWEVVTGSRRIENIGGSQILRLQVRATVA